MFLQPLELTTALRPSLRPEETLLFVQDAIGLYEGYKCPAISTQRREGYGDADSC